MSIFIKRKSLIIYELDTIYISNTFNNNFNQKKNFIWNIEEFEVAVCDFDLNTLPYLCARNRVLGLYIFLSYLWFCKVDTLSYILWKNHECSRGYRYMFTHLLCLIILWRYAWNRPRIHQPFLRIFLDLNWIMIFENHSYKWYFTIKPYQ